MTQTLDLQKFFRGQIYTSYFDRNRFLDTGEVQILVTFLVAMPKHTYNSVDFFYHLNNSLSKKDILSVKEMWTSVKTFRYTSNEQKIVSNSHRLFDHSREVAIRLFLAMLVCYPDVFLELIHSDIFTTDELYEAFCVICSKLYRELMIYVFSSELTLEIVKRLNEIRFGFINHSDATGFIFALGTQELFMSYLSKLRGVPHALYTSGYFRKAFKLVEQYHLDANIGNGVLVYLADMYGQDAINNLTSPSDYEKSQICFDYAKKFIFALDIELVFKNNPCAQVLEFFGKYLNLVNTKYHWHLSQTVRELMPKITVYKQKYMDNIFDQPVEVYACLSRIVHTYFYHDLAGYILEYI